MNSLGDFGQPISTKTLVHWNQLMSSGKLKLKVPTYMVYTFM